MNKKHLLTALKVLIVALLVWFVRDTILTALAKLDEHPWHVQPGWLAAAGGLYLVGLLPAGLFWHRVLCVLGQTAGVGETLRAYYVGHLGKYVPGKAMVVVLRAGLIRSHRVDTTVAAVSVFFETLLMMSVGAAMAAAILAFWFRQHVLLCAVALGLMVAAGLPVVPPVFRRIVGWLRVGRASPTLADRLARLGWRTLFEGVAAMALVWLLLGASLWAVLRAMDVADVLLVAGLPLYVAAVALAMVAGFLSLVPGGAVVRELVLTELMVPQFGQVVALISAVLLRLVWLGSELMISGILYFVRFRRGETVASDG